MKIEIKSGDILYFKNGSKAQLGINYLWVLKQYYDEDLNCKTNDEFDIVKIERPIYKKVYEKEEERKR